MVRDQKKFGNHWCSPTSIAEVCMGWISDFLDPDSGCVQQDQEFGFPSFL